MILSNMTNKSNIFLNIDTLKLNSITLKRKVHVNLVIEDLFKLHRDQMNRANKSPGNTMNGNGDPCKVWFSIST